MGIADRVIEKYSGQNLSQNTIDSGSIGDRVIAKYKGSVQTQQPIEEQPERTFGSFIKDMGIGLVQGVTKVALSGAEFARPTTIKSVFTAPWKYKEPEAADFGVNVFGKRITSIQKSMQDAEKQLKSGEITKKQFAGVAAENALDAISVIPAGKLASIFGKGIAKEAIAQGTKGVVKEVAKESLKKKIVKIAATGAGFGAGYGASEDLKANKETGEIISNAPWNAVMGAGVGLGFAGAAKVAGKMTGKVVNKIKGRSFTDQVAEITQKTTPEQPKGTMADIVTNKDTIVPLKPQEVRPGAKPVQDIIPAKKIEVKPAETTVDVDSMIKGAGIKLKVSDKKSIPALGGKKAQGKSRYNFEDGTGEIVVAKDASPSTKAHELAHVMNFKLGDKKEKFTNQLSKYATGQSKDIPAKVVDFARAEMGKGVPESKILARASELAKTMHEEMKTAARLDKKVEFRLGNPSEEFSTAVGNVITRSGETEQVAPTFSKFVKNQIGQPKEIPVSKKSTTLYHGTNDENFKKIMKDGLVPSEKEGTLGKGIYLGNDEGTAKLFGKKVVRTYLDSKAKILDLSIEKRKLSGTKMNKLVEKARKDGYDGIKTGKQTLVFNKNIIKTEKPIAPVAEKVAPQPVEIKTGAPKETQISAGGKVAKNIAPIKSESINLDKINTTDDVKNTIDTIAKNDKEIIDRQRRGKITNQELDELSEMTGIKTKDIINAKPGSVVNAENALAVRKLMINSAQDLTDFASGMGAAPDEKSLGIFKQKLDKFRGLQNALSGFRSEAGRLLQQFNVKVSPQEYEMMDELIKKVSTISQESGDELSKAMKIGKELKPDNLYQLAIKSGVEARTAFLLYSPTTHAANLVGNTWQALNMPLKKYIAEKISGGKGVVKGEASAHIQGVKDALPEAWKLLKDDMKLIFTGKEIQGLEKMQEVTHGTRKAMETLTRLGVNESTAEKVDSIIKTSFKLLTASDKFFRTVNFAGELYSQGLRKATKEGLKGEALTKRVGQILDNPELDKEMYDDIMKQVDVSLFQENTEASKAVSRIREKYQASKLIIPFVKTPLNVAIETVRTSPLGFLRPTLAKARGKAYTEAEKSLAYAQATVGTALSVVGLGLVSQGKITGGLPTNRAERDEFYASGKQPYSIKVGNQWVSYRRVEPMASVLANTVNAYNTSKESDDWSEAVGKTVSGYVNNFFDQTFLKGISDIYNAASDPDRYGKSFVQSFATSFVPSISRAVTGASDRTYREGETISDAFKKIIPGASTTLPAKVDIFGNEVKKEGGFIEGFVSPFQRAKEVNDPVVKELEKSDYNLTVSGVDKIGGVQLKGEAKEVWLKAVGKETKKALDKLVTSPSFQNKDQVQKDKALKDAVEDIRDRMRKQVTAGSIQYDINKRKKMTKSDQAKFNETQLEGKLTERVKALSANWATK